MFRNFCYLTGLLWLLLPTPSYAASFWSGFKKYWGGFLAEQNGVVMVVLGVGAFGVAIIMFGGKWKK